MASPQKENGYTTIANELLEAICRHKFPENSGSHIRILLFILRKTYGYGKKTDAISLTQIERGTGLARSTVCRALQWLVAHLLLVAGEETKKGVVYGINKDYDQWLVAQVKLVAPRPKTSSTGETHKRNTKEINTHTVATATGNKTDLMGYEHLNDDDVVYEEENAKPKKKSIHRGKAIGQIVHHFFTIQGKRPYISKILAARAGSLIDLAMEYWKNDEAKAVEEVIARINVAKKWYKYKKIDSFGLDKIYENWDIILNEWRKEIE